MVSAASTPSPEPTTVVECGVVYDVHCEECGVDQPVEYRFGAWFCAVHRDRGHVIFVPRDE